MENTLKFKQVIGGYDIQVTNLSESNVKELMEEAQAWFYHDFNHSTLSINLYYGADQVDYYITWRSDGLNGLRNKLNEWLSKKDYYSLELDQWQKEEYLNSKINLHVHKRDQEDLKEYLNDMEQWEIEDQVYISESLNDVTELLFDVFYYSKTRADVDLKLSEILGYYSTNFLCEVDGVYYLFFE